jgi:hypothetical protein
MPLTSSWAGESVDDMPGILIADYSFNASGRDVLI